MKRFATMESMVDVARKQADEDARARAVKKLREVGMKRARLIAELERVTQQCRPLVVEATKAGVSYRRIQELTRIGPATVAKWTTTKRS